MWLKLCICKFMSRIYQLSYLFFYRGTKRRACKRSPGSWGRGSGSCRQGVWRFRLPAHCPNTPTLLLEARDHLGSRRCSSRNQIVWIQAERHIKSSHTKKALNDDHTHTLRWWTHTSPASTDPYLLSTTPGVSGGCQEVWWLSVTVDPAPVLWYLLSHITAQEALSFLYWSLHTSSCCLTTTRLKPPTTDPCVCVFVSVCVLSSTCAVCGLDISFDFYH